MKFAVMVILLALLCGCGGGDVDDDRAFIGPPDCRANPGKCG